MKISYLITCSNETDTLKRLLEQIKNVLSTDELLILNDLSNTSKETNEIINNYLNLEGNIKIISNKLDNNYGGHKNIGIQNCNGDFIMQLDGDELPCYNIIGDILHQIIEANPNVEAFAIPRINDFKGVTDEHAKKWGWKLSSSVTYKRPLINWPNFQFRVFKKDYPRISFKRRLHEKIEGYHSFVCFPPNEEYAIYHDKTIEKQIETNLRYNKMFTDEENRGHNVFEQK